eukprot:scaffold2619_cov123-Isochrysis_galbana.AAC.4
MDSSSRAGNHGPRAEYGSAGRSCWPRLACGCGSHKTQNGYTGRREDMRIDAERDYIHKCEASIALSCRIGANSATPVLSHAPAPTAAPA